ncbi:MAG: hypothetical protein RL456_2859 [Pseudomonadota bacterium]|jgi:hydrogenase maturation factor
MTPATRACVDLVMTSFHNDPKWADAHDAADAESMREDTARGLAAALRELAKRSSPGDAICLHMWADEICTEEA